METGAPIFTPEAALCAGLAALEPYIRDRAVRYAAALEWIVEEPARNDVLEHARAAWDAGLFFEVHELLEPVWLRAKGEDRPRLQGLIMAGAALHHLTRGNIAGARGLLRDAARRLTSGDAHPVLDLAAFGRGLAELAERVANGEITSAADLTDVPALRRR